MPDSMTVQFELIEDGKVVLRHAVALSRAPNWSTAVAVAARTMPAVIREKLPTP